MKDMTATVSFQDEETKRTVLEVGSFGGEAFVFCPTASGDVILSAEEIETMIEFFQRELGRK